MSNESGLFVQFLIDRSVECLSAITDGNAMISSLFLQFCDFATILEFLEQVFPSIPSGPATLSARSVIKSFLNRYSTCDVDLDAEFIQRDLRESSDQVVRFLLPYVNNQKEIQKDDEVTCHHMSFFLLIFKESYPGIWRCMESTFNGLVAKVTAPTLFAITGSDFLYLYDSEPPMDFLKTAEFDFADLPMLFKAQCIFKFPESGRIVQERACRLYPFPSAIPSVDDGWTVSLINTVLANKTGFIDIIADSVLEYLTTGQFEQVTEVTKGIEAMVPFVLCAYQNLLYADLQGCLQILEKSYPKSIAEECLTRFRNDAHLVNMMSYLTSSDVCVADLQYASIPKQLEFVMDSPEILKFGNLKYFSYGEESAVADFDFVRAYQAFKLFIDLLSKPQSRSKAVIQEVGKHIEQIQNRQVQNGLIMDLFSLLFLRNGDKFVVTTRIARELLEVLSKFKTSSLISDGLKLVSSNSEYEACFIRKASDVFKAIQSRNWDRADLLTTMMPRYRMSYLAALGVSAIIERKQIPKEGEAQADLMNLEFLLSADSHNASCMKDETYVPPKSCEYVDFEPKTVGDLEKSIEILCEKFGIKVQGLVDMISSRGSNDVFQALPSNDQWQSLGAVIELFEADYVDFVFTGKIGLQDFSMAKTVWKFFEYLQKYFKAAMLFTRDSEHGVFDRFDIMWPIAGLFNVGDLEGAAQWCEECGLDMFEYVMTNLKWFNIAQNFIDRFQDDHPVECICLCQIGEGLTCRKELPTLVDAPVECEWIEGEAVDYVIENVLNQNSVDLDDYIYRIDPTVLYNRIMAQADDGLPEGLYSLLSQVSYVVPEEDCEKLESVKRKHDFGTSDRQEALDKLLCSDGFDDVLAFLAQNPEYLVHAMNELKSNKEKLDMLLARFPTLHEEFFKGYADDYSMLDLLIKYGPESHAQYLKGVKQLPKEICESCNVMLSSDVRKLILSRQELLFLLRKEMKGVVSDDLVMESMNGIKSLADYTKCFRYVYESIVDDQQRFLEAWHDRISQFRKGLKVVSDSEERIIRRDLSVVVPVIAEMHVDESLSTILGFIKEVVAMRPHRSTGLVYDLSDDSDLGTRMVRFLFDLDANESMVEKCHALFHINMNNYHLNRWAQLISLGLRRQASQYFQDASRQVQGLYVEDLSRYSDPTKAEYLDGTLPFVYILERNSVFDKDAISHVTTENPGSYNAYVYLQCVLCIDEMAPRENSGDVRHYATHCVREKTSVSLLMYQGLFDLGYQRLLSIDGRAERTQAFIRDFYYPAVCMDRVSNLHKFILQQDPELTVTGYMISQLMKYMQTCDLGESLHELSRVTNRYDEAADAAIRQFHRATRNDKRMEFLALADYCIANAIDCREHGSECHPRYVPSSKSMEELKNDKLVIQLQMQALSMCATKAIDFDDTFDILLPSDSSLVNVGAHFLLYRKERPLKELCTLCSVAMNDIIQRLAVILSEKPPSEVIQFVKEERKQNNLVLLKQLKMQLLQILALNSQNDMILNLIPILEEGDLQKQCGLFYEYGFMYEALALAGDDRGIIPLVAHRASELGSETLVQQCIALMGLL